MEPAKRIALDITKDIVIAKMSNSTLSVNADGGKNLADFFEEVYGRVLDIARRED